MSQQSTVLERLHTSVKPMREVALFSWSPKVQAPQRPSPAIVEVEPRRLAPLPNSGVALRRRTIGDAAVYQALQATYARLLAAIPEHEHWVVAVASALDGEGRTTVAAGLASMLAQDLPGQVLLVDGHIERPALHELMEVPLAPGFSDCLDEASLILQAVHRSGDLLVLPAGSGLPATTAGDGLRTRDVMKPIRQLFKVTIVDLPPALGTPDAALISRWADAVLWVVRSESTSFSAVRNALGLVGREKLLGVVLNGRRERLPDWLEKYV